MLHHTSTKRCSTLRYPTPRVSPPLPRPPEGACPRNPCRHLTHRCTYRGLSRHARPVQLHPCGVPRWPVRSVQTPDNRRGPPAVPPDEGPPQLMPWSTPQDSASDHRKPESATRTLPAARAMAPHPPSTRQGLRVVHPLHRSHHHAPGRRLPPPAAAVIAHTEHHSPPLDRHQNRTHR